MVTMATTQYCCAARMGNHGGDTIAALRAWVTMATAQLLQCNLQLSFADIKTVIQLKTLFEHFHFSFGYV